MGLPLIHLEEPYRSRAVPPANGSVLELAVRGARVARSADRRICAERRVARADRSRRPSARPRASSSPGGGGNRTARARARRFIPSRASSRRLPRAACVDFAPLNTSLEAAARHVAGAPLERGTELEPHGAALWATPLMTAAHLAARARGAVRARRAARRRGARARRSTSQESLADYRRECAARACNIPGR